MRRERQPGEGLDMRMSICGWSAVLLTDSTVEVTCKHCKRRLAEAPPVPEVPEVLGVEAPAVRGAHELTPGQVALIEKSKAAGLDEPRARFRGWEALHRQHAGVIDDGSPVRSSSDPGRFGARVQSSGGAVRMPSGRDDMIEVDVALERATATVLIVGPHRLTGAQQRAVYLARCEGRPLVGRIAPDRKGLVTTRVPLSAAQVAERLGGDWTPHHVGLVVRAVRARMAPILVSKGILPERAMPEEREAMKIPGFDLDGWKEIADALGCSEATARRKREEGLPVRTIDSSGRVIASRAEIAAWLRAQVRAS